MFYSLGFWKPCAAAGDDKSVRALLHIGLEYYDPYPYSHTRSAPQYPMSAVYCHCPSLYLFPLLVILALAVLSEFGCLSLLLPVAVTVTVTTAVLPVLPLFTLVKEGETEAATVTADTLKPARPIWELVTLAPLLAAVN